MNGFWWVSISISIWLFYSFILETFIEYLAQIDMSPVLKGICGLGEERRACACRRALDNGVNQLFEQVSGAWL